MGLAVSVSGENLVQGRLFGRGHVKEGRRARGRGRRGRGRRDVASVVAALARPLGCRRRVVFADALQHGDVPVVHLGGLAIRPEADLHLAQGVGARRRLLEAVPNGLRERVVVLAGRKLDNKHLGIVGGDVAMFGRQARGGGRREHRQAQVGQQVVVVHVAGGRLRRGAAHGGKGGGREPQDAHGLPAASAHNQDNKCNSDQLVLCSATT